MCVLKFRQSVGQLWAFLPDLWLQSTTLPISYLVWRTTDWRMGGQQWQDLRFLIDTSSAHLPSSISAQYVTSNSDREPLHIRIHWVSEQFDRRVVDLRAIVSSYGKVKRFRIAIQHFNDYWTKTYYISVCWENWAALGTRFDSVLLLQWSSSNHVVFFLFFFVFFLFFDGWWARA